MRNLSHADILKKSQEFFKRFEKEGELLAVSDGNLFFSGKKSLAQSHAKRNGDLKIFSITREEVFAKGSEEKGARKKSALKKSVSRKGKSTPDNRAADNNSTK